MRIQVVIALLVGCSGCGLLLDAELSTRARDGGGGRDGSTVDGGAVDGRVVDGGDGDGSAVDGGRLDAAGVDTGPSGSDGGRADAMVVGDAGPADVGPRGCAAAIAAATELSAGTTASDSTCSMEDFVDFDCISTSGTYETYYFVEATGPMTILLSAGSGADGFVFSRIDPTDCSVVSCGHSLLPIGPDGRVYFAVEQVMSGGCGAAYSVTAVSGWP
jgi:hypothetical protein